MAFINEVLYFRIFLFLTVSFDKHCFINSSRHLINYSNFTLFENDQYGNCYTFNYKPTGEEVYATKTGPKFGKVITTIFYSSFENVSYLGMLSLLILYISIIIMTFRSHSQRAPSNVNCPINSYVLFVYDFITSNCPIQLITSNQGLKIIDVIQRRST